MSNYDAETTFLVASPSFWQGFASAIDLGGTLIQYNESKTPQEADMRAIASDWAITGKDILTAAENIAQK